MVCVMNANKKKSDGFMLHRFSIFNGMDNYNIGLIWNRL